MHEPSTSVVKARGKNGAQCALVAYAFKQITDEWTGWDKPGSFRLASQPDNRGTCFFFFFFFNVLLYFF